MTVPLPKPGLSVGGALLRGTGLTKFDSYARINALVGDGDGGMGPPEDTGFAPLVPALLIGIAAGVAIVRLIGTEVTHSTGESVCRATQELCDTDPMTYQQYVITHEVVLAVPVPWAALALLLGFALVVTLLAVGAGFVVLRSSTDLEELRAG